MMYSAHKLNKQGDNIQPWRTPFPIWNQSVVPCPVLLLPDLHTGFSRGRSGGLVFPSPSEFSTVHCDPHRLTDLESKLMVPWWRGKYREFGNVMYTLLHSKWVTNKDLLHSTWDSTLYYVPAWIGGGFGEERIHVHVWLSPFAFTWNYHDVVYSAIPKQECNI